MKNKHCKIGLIIGDLSEQEVSVNSGIYASECAIAAALELGISLDSNVVLNYGIWL